MATSSAKARWLDRVILTAIIALMFGLTGCAHPGRRGFADNAVGRNYAPPGPPEDPWRPYIQEASQRFQVPERWIREVMRQESGGHEYLHGGPVTSDAGAMGLMQVMPATYQVLRDHYHLEDDAYNPHANILAGTAYIKEMYDRYGAPGFLAAYNAGPARLDDYLSGVGSLPNETVNYLASIAPRLGTDPPMTGPLAAFAGPQDGSAPLQFASVNTPVQPPTSATLRRPDGCFYDPDAAYDPSAPCRPTPVKSSLAPAVPFAPPSATPVTAGNCSRDPDAAYDPMAVCSSERGELAPRVVSAANTAGLVGAGLPESSWGRTNAAEAWNASAALPQSAHVAVQVQPLLFPRALAQPLPISSPSPTWGVQVGAFYNSSDAERAADKARSMQPDILHSARTTISQTMRSGVVLYRARLEGLTSRTASQACGGLSRAGWQCVQLPPGT